MNYFDISHTHLSNQNDFVDIYNTEIHSVVIPTFLVLILQ